MSWELRRLNDQGLSAFQQWLDDGAVGIVPVALLDSPETSDKILIVVPPKRTSFSDRLDFGWYLVELLKSLNSRTISGDINLWSSLALLWFDLLCPPNATGGRKLDKQYRYILTGNFQTYYRHLVRTPWQLVRDHGDDAKFMLIRPREVIHPLSVHGEILEQFGGRQRVMGSKPIIRAANKLYLDPLSQKPRKGVAGAGPGAALRFGKVVRQLDLTFDPEAMSPDQFIAILPKEFGKWRKALTEAVKPTLAAAAE